MLLFPLLFILYRIFGNISIRNLTEYRVFILCNIPIIGHKRGEIMLSFAPLETLLNNKDIRKTALKTEKVINGSTYTFIAKAMKTPVKEGLSISAIDNLCKYLNCQPGDLMEYVPDNSSDQL